MDNQNQTPQTEQPGKVMTPGEQAAVDGDFAVMREEIKNADTVEDLFPDEPGSEGAMVPAVPLPTAPSTFDTAPAPQPRDVMPDDHEATREVGDLLAGAIVLQPVPEAPAAPEAAPKVLQDA